jgi:hypothetical protein
VLWGLEYSRLRDVWFEASGGRAAWGDNGWDKLSVAQQREHYGAGPSWQALRDHEAGPKRYSGPWHRSYWGELQLYAFILFFFTGFILGLAVSPWFFIMMLFGYFIPLKDFREPRT